MYLNLNGTGLVLQLLALTSVLALGLKLSSLKRRRPRAVRVRHEVRRSYLRRD